MIFHHPTEMIFASSQTCRSQSGILLPKKRNFGAFPSSFCAQPPFQSRSRGFLGHFSSRVFQPLHNLTPGIKYRVLMGKKPLPAYGSSIREFPALGIFPLGSGGDPGVSRISIGKCPAPGAARGRIWAKIDPFWSKNSSGKASAEGDIVQDWGTLGKYPECCRQKLGSLQSCLKSSEEQLEIPRECVGCLELLSCVYCGNILDLNLSPVLKLPDFGNTTEFYFNT